MSDRPMPDEVYVCERPSEISLRFTTLECCKDEKGIGGWTAIKYIRADLSPAPSPENGVKLGRPIAAYDPQFGGGDMFGHEIDLPYHDGAGIFWGETPDIAKARAVAACKALSGNLLPNSAAVDTDMLNFLLAVRDEINEQDMLDLEDKTFGTNKADRRQWLSLETRMKGDALIKALSRP